MYSENKRFAFSIIIFFLLFRGDAASQINAELIDSPIKLDGYLNESVWKNVEPVTDFTQRELTEGAPVSEKT